MARGLFTVHWQVVASDGDPAQHRFVVVPAVGAALTGPVDPLTDSPALLVSSLLRWMLFVVLSRGWAAWPATGSAGPGRHPGPRVPRP